MSLLTQESRISNCLWMRNNFFHIHSGAMHQQGARPTTATSAKSQGGKSFLSLTHSQKSLLLNLKNSKWTSKLKDYGKLSLLILPPLIVVMGLCGLTLNSVKADIDLQNRLEENVKSAQAVGALVSNLQKERGMTCLYITTLNSGNETAKYEAFAKMIQFRIETDSALDRIQVWLGDENDGPEFSNKTNFKQNLINYRTSVNPEMRNCDRNIQFYTNIDEKLIEQMNHAFHETDDGKFWAAMESYHAMLLSKDYFGLQRALGGSFFAQGRFPDLQTYAYFAKITGAAEKLLSMSLDLTPQAGVFYQKKIVQYANLVYELDNFKKQICDNGATNASAPEVQKSLVWFSNMSTYLTVIIGGVEKTISDLILISLRKRLQDGQTGFDWTLGAVVAVLVLCPPLTIWYAVQSKKLMGRIKNFTDKLTNQTKQLNVEKKRADLLLYQLLPKTIVTELKQNKAVLPEHYDSATIYFSDIQGFTTLSSRSTPFQVVDLLNKLYTRCDNVLDQYDVHKVETIGDAYMVVSGVPKRNGHNHSAEIASMSLNILMVMEEFIIPHMPNERLLMRIGIHTGPVAAGVVGTKMPRYCLFGDTVNMASKMESNGLALRIHVSQQTNQHLEEKHPDVFETILRGPLEIKGKEAINTYWLLGKHDFPYRIDLDRAAELASKSTYWKM